MEHYFKEIPGFFTFPDFYAWVAGEMIGKPSPHLVEVGIYHGQSAAFLGVELVNRGVSAQVDLVDQFHDSPPETVMGRLAKIPVAWRIQKGCSWNVAARYPDESLDFVFLDANHDRDSISRDIDAWRPKVKKGGLLAGHDYIHWQNPEFGVVRAVNERFARFEVWPGITDGGDAQMQGHFFPCWCVRL